MFRDLMEQVRNVQIEIKSTNSNQNDISTGQGSALAHQKINVNIMDIDIRSQIRRKTMLNELIIQVTMEFKRYIMRIVRYIYSMLYKGFNEAVN